MCQCFETIKVEDGTIQHLSYHQQRFDKTRVELFGLSDKINLNDFIKVKDDKTYRVKVVYAKEIEEVLWQEYKQERIFETFYLKDLDFDYSYKYVDRKMMDTTKDLIYVEDGFLKDTQIANIALMIDNVWLTPKYPMLKGTTRARLLESGFIKEENLDKNSLEIAQKFAIMNALMGFKIIENIRIDV